ncbi:MAG: MFS transporter, partial [Candidatus Thorarchaeota archaeon]|nr:MFS transporter [Candidatus Thorarchaeota archaeon]
ISTSENIGKIGGFGYAAGYVGAMLTIIIALVSTEMFPTQPTLPFLFSAIFFLVFAIPSIIGLKSRPPPMKPEGGAFSYVSIGFNRIRQTAGEIRKYKGLPLFLLSYFLVAEAIDTIISFAAIFGQDVYLFSNTMILIFFAVTQLTAIPGAFIFGFIADRIGTKRTLIITLFIWIAAIFIAWLGQPYGEIVWWTVGMIAGVGMGSAQSTARSMFGQMIPEEKKSEMFGFYALTGKVAAIFGPAVYSSVLLWAAGPLGLSLANSHIAALLSVLIFFIVALILLLRVPEPASGAQKTEIYLDDDISPS